MVARVFIVGTRRPRDTYVKPGIKNSFILRYEINQFFSRIISRVSHMETTKGGSKQITREMDLLSDFENMDVILADGNSNPIERELVNPINASTSRNDTEASSTNRGNSSQENEIRDFSVENEFHRRDKFAESMETFSNEMNTRHSQEMDSLMSLMRSHINRAVSSAITDRVIKINQIS